MENSMPSSIEEIKQQLIEDSNKRTDPFIESFREGIKNLVHHGDILCDGTFIPAQKKQK